MVMALVVYVDVLIFLNILVDYFLLLLTAKISGEKAVGVRLVLASVLGGVFSLYIFLSVESKLLDLAAKFIFAFCVSAVGFGVKKIKRLIKNTLLVFIVSIAYAGCMFFFWSVFKPRGMVVNNSVVYFSISPTVLVIFSVGGYLLFTLLWKIFKKGTPFAETCELTVVAGGKSIKLCAIADTGNSLEDVFENGEIIISDKRSAERLFGETDVSLNFSLKTRYRVIPCGTVSGGGVLEGYRCDSATVEHNGKKTVLEKPILAVAKTEFNDDCDAIINPKILRWLV